MINPKLHDRLKEINTELTAIEKQIMRTAIRLDANLLEEIVGVVDGMIDYEMAVTIACYGVDGIDYPLCTLQEGLKHSSKETEDERWGMDDGENHNEFEFRQGHPMFGEHHCWLFHCLYDHNYLTWEEIASIQNFWVNILPCYQYRFDAPDKHFAPSTRHVLYSNNYDIIFDDVVRDIIPNFSETCPLDLRKFTRISRDLWGDTARLNLNPMSDEELSVFHTPKYLQSLREDKNIIEGILGFSIPASITAAMVNENLIDAARTMTTGTVVAAELALTTGWAINIGGGFHRAKSDCGGGFSFFNDYAIATHKLRQINPDLKILYVDLNAHIGDGVISFARAIDNFYILDIHNAFADLAEDTILKTDFKDRFTLIGLKSSTRDKTYLGLLREHLPSLIDSIKPEIIFYNGGSDILEGDSSGQLCITPEGMKERDLFVFGEAKKRSIPIMMCLSGGYGKKNFKHVADSLEAVIEMMEGE